MKKLFSIIVSIAMVLFGTALVSPAQDDVGPAPCDFKQIGLDASKFYLYLTKDTPYTRWPVRPGKDKLTPGKKPHGQLLTTYTNPAAHEAIINREAMPYGSILVTENYDADKKPLGLMIMLKIKGYNPPAGDWYWFHYDAGGAVLSSGRVPQCITCHRERKDNDFIMTGPVGPLQRPDLSGFK